MAASMKSSEIDSHDGYGYGATEICLDNFLGSPKDMVKKNVIWSKSSLPEYEGCYATVLDDAFSPEECETLIRLAEHTTNDKWEPAMVNVGDMAGKIWNRVKDHVPEVHSLKGMPRVTGRGPAKRGETWKATRLNERMRFLKYGPEHEDGCYETSDGMERSYFTLHLYLNEGAVGGATSFHSWQDTWDEEYRKGLDLEPKIGRVLIFQQKGLLHSGAEVESGIKYTLRTDVMYGEEGGFEGAEQEHGK